MGKLENSDYLVTDRDKIHEGIRELAFVTAAMESADDTVLFIDPDKLDGATPEERLEQFQDQFNSLKPGAYDAFRQALSDKGSILKDSFFSEKASYGLPYAVPNIPIDDEDFCIIVKPSREFDTADEIGELYFPHYDEDIKNNIINNLALNNDAWNKYAGHHEGEHCNTTVPQTNHDTLTEESRADRNAWSQYDNTNTISALKDMRRLSPHIAYDIKTGATHATAPWNDDNFIATPLHIKAAEIYRDMSNSEINNNFNWERYSGEAQKAEELLKENPELYFSAMHKAFDETEQEINDALSQNFVSYDDLKKSILAEYSLHYMREFEDAYRRRALGQDIPERDHTKHYVSDHQKAIYAAENPIRSEAEHNGLNYIVNHIYNRHGKSAFDDIARERGHDSPLTFAQNLYDAHSTEYYDILHEEIKSSTQALRDLPAGALSPEQRETLLTGQSALDHLEINAKQRGIEWSAEEHILTPDQKKHFIRDWALERIEEEKNTQELEQSPSVANNKAQQETIIYTAHLKSALPTGEPSYDQTGNLTVSETSLPDTFKQSAQPETYGISYQNEALEAHETQNISSPSVGVRV